MAKIETPRPVRGTQDMLGGTPEAFQERFAHVVATFDRVRRLYGFQRVEVPVFEATAVFARSLGESTDVVSKEMYTFEDRGGDSITLRPEFTAGISRAYITEGWQQYAPLKVATHGPLFRYERPQKGRFRQFHQLDAEIIGAGEPGADVELLVFADQLLRELGVSDGVTRLSPISRRIAPSFRRTASTASIAIRCVSSTARTRATARWRTARRTSMLISPTKRAASLKR